MPDSLLFVTDSVLLSVVYLALLVWCATLAACYITCGVCRSKARLDGKTVILTGCTSGIGVPTAFDLARRGARLIMACRNVEKANEVRKDIIETTKNQNVIVMELDVSVLRSVRKFAAEVNEKERRLDVLIHNAGIVDGGDRITEDGINMVWATNHFGPFLLTHLLIDLLKKTGKSRIIYVSSYLHYVGSLSLRNPNRQKERVPGAFYNSTKFANVLIARELARRLQSTGVTSNSLHPGLVDTPIIDQTPTWLKLLTFLIRPVVKTVEQGAQTTIHLAVSEAVEGVTGEFFSDCEECPPARKTRDLELAQKYWKISEEIVRLKPSDPHI